MSKFCEIKDDEKIKIDRENLYYYYKDGVYAILIWRMQKYIILKTVFGITIKSIVIF